ncbi:GNAT family N-acetyltransferase [Phyllobacterium sp. NPDC097923]|uniref:GNAT family N-acetyltransferase n=1 Tax=Phyllobacterium sp. NPDC097923 TaxID=3364404 RepID=UPI00383B6A23
MLAQWLMRKHTWLTLTEARLNLIHPPSRMSTLAIGIYDTASLGRGLGSRAIRLTLGHAFLTIRLHRIGIRVPAYNRRAIRTYEKCGFIVEGRERETALVNGTRHDDIMMGLLEHEFQSQ